MMAGAIGRLGRFKPQPEGLVTLLIMMSWAPLWAALLLGAGLAGGSACPAAPDTVQLPNTTSSGYLEIGDGSRLFYLYYEAAGGASSSDGSGQGRPRGVPITLWLQVSPIQGAAMINGERTMHPPASAAAGCRHRPAPPRAAASTRLLLTPAAGRPWLRLALWRILRAGAGAGRCRPQPATQPR